MKNNGKKRAPGRDGSLDTQTLIDSQIRKGSDVLRLGLAQLDNGQLDPNASLSTYDAVVCDGLLESLEDPRILLDQLKGILRPEGRLILSVPNASHAAFVTGLLDGDPDFNKEGPAEEQPRRLFTRQGIIGLLEESGYRPGWIESVRQPLKPDAQSGGQSDLVRQSLANYLVSLPDTDASSFVVVAGRAGEGQAENGPGDEEMARWAATARRGEDRLTELVDIVIPVFDDLESVSRCLESVLSQKQVVDFDVVVIVDESAGPEIVDHLRLLEKAGKIILMATGTDTGFADAANLGMLLNPDRDVVLLESDTEVNGDWLDRLRRCVASAPDVGIVTPFSNNAMYLSYPRTMRDNHIPQGETTASLDAYFKDLNTGLYVDLPSAVGFCNYITRRCLDEAGYLDSLHFGHGYNHENDLSLRAMLKGFTRWLCGDVFVFHAGRFFQPPDRALAAEASRQMSHRHPGFDEMSGEHRLGDPERPLRRRIDLERLERSPRGRILFLNHKLGGVVEKHAQELARLLQTRYDVLTIRPETGDGFGGGERALSIEWMRTGEEFRARFPLPDAYGDLLDFLRRLGLERLHIHHLHGFDEWAPGLVRDLGLPYDYTVYDYYALCPRFDMVDQKGDFCGKPELKDCHACLAGDPCFEGEMGARRAAFEGLLEGAQRVLVPSHHALEAMKEYFPKADYVYLPFPETGRGEAAKPDENKKIVKVLALGESSLVSGTDLLEACAAGALQKDLPLHFSVMGRKPSGASPQPGLPLKYLGPYEEADLKRLIELERADIIFFPARWPCVHSCSLDAARLTGLPVVAPDLGVFPEALDDYGRAHLLASDSAPDVWNDLFMSLAED
ncbi:MAG: methyltransferase domain-containing protein [Thermoleophilia bacterium]|jgi:GT2 family glycosyltransferase